MLEQRVAALEADMRDVKGALTRIEAALTKLSDQVRNLDLEMREIKGRVSQLPTAWMMVTGGAGFLLAAFAFAFAVVRFAVPH